MSRRMFAICVALVMVVGMAVSMPVAGGQTVDNPNLDLTIDPTQGLPGEPIDTSVPPEQAFAECIVDLDELIDEVLAATDLLDPAGLAATILGLAEAEIPDVIEGLGIDVGLFFVLAFADIVTQEPIVTDNWDPITGTGSITPPDGTPFDLYAVAALCIGLNEFDPEDLSDTLDAIAASIPGLGACLADPGGQACTDAGGPAAVIGGAVEAFVGTILVTLLPDEEDPNIVGFGFSLYCLGDDAFCDEVPIPITPVTPAEPVSTTPRFTG